MKELVNGIYVDFSAAIKDFGPSRFRDIMFFCNITVAFLLFLARAGDSSHVGFQVANPAGLSLTITYPKLT